MYRVIAQWTFLLMLMGMVLAPMAENALHQGAGTNVLDVAENRDMVAFLWLPAFFDAVVDKSDETSCNDYAMSC